MWYFIRYWYFKPANPALEKYYGPGIPSKEYVSNIAVIDDETAHSPEKLLTWLSTKENGNQIGELLAFNRI